MMRTESVIAVICICRSYFLDVVRLYRRPLLCRNPSRIPAISKWKSFPFLNFVTYLLLPILNLRYLEWFLLSLVCSRYLESFVLRRIAMLKWFRAGLFGWLHTRSLAKNVWLVDAWPHDRALKFKMATKVVGGLSFFRQVLTVSSRRNTEVKGTRTA